MMFLVQESCSFNVIQPIATYIAASEEQMLAYFEPWFANEPHVITDQEGATYIFISKNSQTLRMVKQEKNISFDMVKRIAGCAFQNAEEKAAIYDTQNTAELTAILSHRVKTILS